MYCIFAHPKEDGQRLWLTAEGKFSKHSWKAAKIPGDLIEFLIKTLEGKYKTFHFDSCR